MRVLLISANTERLNMPSLPLGLGLVAAATREAGHEVAFLDLLSEGDAGAAVRQAVADGSPDVIGVSVRNIDNQDIETPEFLVEPVQELVATCRAASRAPIVLGGAGYSIFPDAALAYLGADLGVRGEGEAVFPRLLEAIERGEDPLAVPGVHAPGRGSPTPRTFVQDLDALPFPAEEFGKSVDPGAPDVWLPVQTRRGCPLGCIYCSTGLIEGLSLRARSPRHVARHMALAADAGFRRFYFVDNTFNRPPEYALELCRSIGALGRDLPWRAILYPHDVSEALVAAMAEAGCVEVALGFESGCARVLRSLNKRFGPDEVRAVSNRLAAHGIRRMGFLLLGVPGETRQSVEESLAFAKSLGLDMLKITAGIRIYPETPLARLAVEQGVVTPEDDLLRPRFYLRPELADWIREVVAQREGPSAK